MAALLPVALQRTELMLAVKDAATGRYVLVDAAMAVFLGKPAQALIGTADSDCFEPALAAVLRAAEQTALAQGEPLLSEHRFDWRGARRASRSGAR